MSLVSACSRSRRDRPPPRRIVRDESVALPARAGEAPSGVDSPGVLSCRVSIPSPRIAK